MVDRHTNYDAKNKKSNELSKEFHGEIIDRFGSLVEFLIYYNPTIVEPMYEHLSAGEKKILWKGLIMQTALSSLSIKNLIRRILERLNYDANITMREFYDISKKKVQLNFMAVESRTESVAVINHITRPNMPLWAALLATSSLPYFYRPITDYKTWRNSEKRNKNIEVASFFSEKSHRQEYLQSANKISKIPLELVTN